MWLINLYRKWREPKVVVAEPIVIDELNPRKACLFTLDKLNPTVFSLYQVDAGESVFIRPHFENIDLYAEKLREASMLIARGKAIKNTWVPKEGQRMCVDNFLVSNDGYYLDSFKAVERFKENAIKLCHGLAKSDDAEYGVDEHNLRMLSKLLVNIRETTEALIRVSEMN
jgi:hypothetical protein